MHTRRPMCACRARSHCSRPTSTRVRRPSLLGHTSLLKRYPVYTEVLYQNPLKNPCPCTWTTSTCLPTRSNNTTRSSTYRVPVKMPVSRISTPHTSMMDLFHKGQGRPSDRLPSSRRTFRMVWVPMIVAVTICVIQEPWVARTFFEPADDKVCADLYEWIVKGGGVVRGIKCMANEGGGGRGLRITEKLPADTTYIELPRSLWLWAETVFQHSKISKLLKEGGDEKVIEACGKYWGHSDGRISPCRLILAMEFEKYQSDSYWKPYFATLPEQPTSLVFWDRPAIEAMQSTTLEYLYESQLDRFTATHTMLFPYLCDTYPDIFTDCSKHTLHSWKVSAINVKARNFAAYHIDADNQTKRRTSEDPRWPLHWSDESTGVLLPYADLSNHDSSLGSPYGDLERRNYFTLKAANNFDVGSELAFSYGSQHPSGYFVDLYGFIPSGYVKSDFVTLEARVKRMRGGDKYDKVTAFIGVDGNIIPEEFPQWCANAWYPQKANDAGVQQAKAHIMASITARLTDLPTTYQQDMDELQQGFKSYTQWVSVNVRTRFKRCWLTGVESLKFSLTNKKEAIPYHLRPSSWIMNYEAEYKTWQGPTPHTINFALDAITLTTPSDL
eukprot:m.234084 g.234084  ORF g.234084 m.234084 type:complete len:612 (-) comp33650_c1_seq2:140-1975(-)